MFTGNYDSSFFFWVFEKRLTQENCFFFCKRYGLFNGYMFLTNKEIFSVLISKLSWSAFGRGGGQGLSISYLNQSCFSDGEDSLKEPIQKQFNSK